MKKIAAIAIACGLTAGVTAMSQPAEAYAVKPTLCQLVGAGHSARVFVEGKAHQYPAAFYVKAPGGVPRGAIHVYYSGATNLGVALPATPHGLTFRAPLSGKGRLVVKFGYRGSPGFSSCSAHFTVTIK